jgi:hypothetical protein
LLVVHLAVTAALAGLIWTIQLVHYPLFDHVEEAKFVGFEQRHSWRISLIVGPLMGAELIAAVIVVWERPPYVSAALAIAALVVLLVVHAATVLFSVPAHAVLGRGFDADAHRRLVQTNWIRTVGWTARAAMAVVMVSSSPIGG